MVRLESKLFVAAKCTLVVVHMFVRGVPVYKQEEAEHILVMVVAICKLEVEITKQEQAEAVGYKLAITAEHILLVAMVEDDRL